MKIRLSKFEKGDRIVHLKGGQKGSVIQITKTSLQVIWDGNWKVKTWIRKKSVQRILNQRSLRKKLRDLGEILSKL